MQIDLSFYLDPPELTHRGELIITPLAPLSMVSQQPGSYFRSELSPTKEMLYGLVENAAGWHFHDGHRLEIIKGLSKLAKKRQVRNFPWQDHPWLGGKLKSSASGYASLLQFHLAFSEVEGDPEPLAWDDLWSMLNRADSISFIGGSRNYDFRLEDLISASRKAEPAITFGDRKEFVTYTLEELKSLAAGQVNVKSLSPNFPQFYSSPRKRGYVEPAKSWVYEVSCTAKVAEIISKSLSQPAAPLYLGSNDGWVHAKWKSHD